MTPVLDQGYAPKSPEHRLRRLFVFQASHLNYLVALALFVVLSVIFNWPTIADIGHRISGTGGDSTGILWALNWFPFAVAHHLNPFAANFSDYPTTTNMIAEPGALQLVSIITLPLNLAFGPIVTYNIIVTATFVANGFSMYFVLRRWIGGAVAPLVGATSFMFCPYMTAQGTGHTGLISLYLVPIIVWLVTDILFLKRHSPTWDAVALGLLCAAQLLLTEELLFGTLIMCAVVTIVYALSDRFQSTEWRPVVRSLGIALFAFGCAAVPLLGYQLYGPGHFSGLVHNLNFYNLDLLNPLLPTPGLRFIVDGASYFKTLGWTAQGIEMQGYVGPLLLISILVLACRNWKNIYTRIAVVLLVVFLVFSLGPSLHVAGIDLEFWLPWRAIQSLPIINNVLPSRLFVFAYFGIAIAVSIAIDFAIKNWKRVAGAFMGATAFLGVLAWLPRNLLPYNAPDVPSFFTSSAVNEIPAGSIVFVNGYQDSVAANWLPELWQVEANMRFKSTAGALYLPGPNHTVYFGWDVPNALTSTIQAVSTGNLSPALTTPTLLGSMRKALFDQFHADDAIVGPMGEDQSQVIQLMTMVTGKRPQFVGGVALWTNLQAEARHEGFIR